MGNSPYDYDEIMAERFRVTLDHFMTKTGTTAKSLGRLLGIQPDTIESYRQGITKPQYHLQWRIIKHFGAQFLNEIAEPAGITGAFDQDTEQGCPHSVISHLSHTIHILAKALEDGHIDAKEKRELRNKFPVLKAVLKAFEGSL